MKLNIFLLIILSVFTTLIACNKILPQEPISNETLDGPIEGLSTADYNQFLRGDVAFNEVFTSSTGLGPVFVANQCASCHAGDGKGTPFVQFVRFGQSDTTGNSYLQFGGPQLQHKALPGYAPEQLPAGAPFTRLIAPSVSGLGFLDAVEDLTLIQLSDPFDANGDGISGRPHYTNIPSYVQPRANSIPENGKYICRFGKKGAAYDLLHQTAGAYNQDMGITSVFERLDVYSLLEIDPEIATNTVRDVVFYLKTLKAPTPRNQTNTDVLAGKSLFESIQCAKCHTPTLTTGYSPISVLSYKVFHPYTDMLLHDMGSELNDGYTEGHALASEWKTPPLWGLGLSKISQGGQYYLLHDGRATSIESAILFHDGEASQSKAQYQQLNSKEKSQLIQFLESL